MVDHLGLVLYFQNELAQNHVESPELALRLVVLVELTVNSHADRTHRQKTLAFLTKVCYLFVRVVVTA